MATLRIHIARYIASRYLGQNSNFQYCLGHMNWDTAG